MKFAITSLLAAAVLFLAPTPDASACGDKEKTTVAKVSVDELDAMLQKKAVVVYDVNGKDTRDKVGVIRGAKLLGHYSEFKAADLPKSKESSLVFYCYNESCGASKKAAEKAIGMGYKNSKILPAGIVGWKKAGKPLAVRGQS